MFVGFSCTKLAMRGELPIYKTVESALTATHRQETKQLGYTASNGEARSVMFHKQRSSLAYHMLVLDKQKFDSIEVKVRDLQEAINEGRLTLRKAVLATAQGSLLYLEGRKTG